MHMVRVGLMGNLGLYRATEPVRYPPARRVIVRGPRGLEVGQVVAAVTSAATGECAGTLLRPTTVEDELLAVRLLGRRDEAYAACVSRLAKRSLPVTLLDVEQLFDGRTLIFHFLGDTPPELDEILDELAAAYENKVEIRRFARLLAQGCGPQCGTGVACGGGCESCAIGSAVAGGCTRGKSP